MSDVTAVPLRPIAKGSVTRLWIAIIVAIVIGVGFAWAGTRAQVAMAQPAAQFLANNAKRKDVHTTPSGLQYQVIREGSGPHPTAQDTVLVDYDGKLADGRTFDASAQHGGPAQLPVGGLIPGWVEGLQLMNPGAKYKFWIPPALGYGPAGAGNGVIPPNALLIFDVDMLAIAPPQAMGMGGMGGMGGVPGGR